LGKPFEIFKLRTMRMDAERDGAQWSSVKGDKRVTAVGRLLRMFRVDEIPQLWNILRGDMSFVGPRPERPEFVKELAEKVPYYMERMLVPPGLTGWAQVNYPYASSIEDAQHKLEYDLYYIKHMGLLLDLFVLLDTVKTVLQGGATLRFPERRDVTAHLHEVLRMESRA
jgi:lipopolysaccharide/colanic/teichoic acid biosynthesis glycosyltransferase